MQRNNVRNELEMTTNKDYLSELKSKEIFEQLA